MCLSQARFDPLRLICIPVMATHNIISRTQSPVIDTFAFYWSMDTF